MPEKLGDRIRRLRLAKGWSLDDVAAQLNTAKSTLGKIETGKTKDPGASLALALAQLFGVTVEELIGDEDIPKYPEGPPKPSSLIESAVRALGEEIPVYRYPPWTVPASYIILPKIGDMMQTKDLKGFEISDNDFRSFVNPTDIIIVAKEPPPKIGQNIACAWGKRLLVGKLTEFDGHRAIVNDVRQVAFEDCELFGTVIFRVTPYLNPF